MSRTHEIRFENKPVFQYPLGRFNFHHSWSCDALHPAATRLARRATYCVYIRYFSKSISSLNSLTPRSESDLIWIKGYVVLVESWRLYMRAARPAPPSRRRAAERGSCGRQPQPVLLLASDGRVFSFGAHGDGGRLGHGDQSSQRTPRLVTALLREMRVVQIAAGDANSLALDVDAVV